MDNHITFDDLFSADLYKAATLAERHDLFVKQSDGTASIVRDARERHAVVFSAHVLVTMATVLRNDGQYGGENVSQAAIAKALRTNGKRITMVKQILENGAPFATLFMKQRGKYILSDDEIAAHVVGVLQAETGGRSVETLHKVYGKVADDTVTDGNDDEQTDDTVTTEPTDGFDPEHAAATFVMACRNRGMADSDILAIIVAKLGG